ncbi:hypothetical protein OH799_32930 [Nocardia sp. NBC_00881]|uniref:hypothetical protein n=1 Tax=Nocardia sp. NBC_00881 TaxID=2975995 RepID=UPI003867F038|nr:hypothetical protein OH799_32930 [Nocardia sp. NBC_00881]
MEREHEEAMRADYSTYAELGRQMFRPSTSEAEIQLIDMQQQVLADRWESGPHAQHWQYLDDAHEDWKRSPKVMVRMLADIDHNGGAGVSGVQRRSLEQARQLTGNDRPRPQVERGR